MNLFKGKITCTQCGKNYKHKKERKKSVYICSGYTNYGKSFCSRRKIDEDTLLFLVRNKLNTDEITRDIIESNIRHILIDQEGNIEIEYKDSTKSFLNNNNLIV